MEGDFPISVEDRVRFSDLDGFGHLNNARYFSFFEQARLAYMEAIGLVEPASSTHGRFSFILLETRCRFLKPCFRDDRVVAQARVSRVGTTSCEMEYRVLRGGEPVAEGSGVVVYYDYEKGEKAPLPEELKARIDRLQGLPPHVGNPGGPGLSFT